MFEASGTASKKMYFSPVTKGSIHLFCIITIIIITIIITIITIIINSSSSTTP